MGTSWWAGPKDPSLAGTGLTTAPQVHLGAGGCTWDFRTWHMVCRLDPQPAPGTLLFRVAGGYPPHLWGSLCFIQAHALLPGPSTAQPAYVTVPSAWESPRRWHQAPPGVKALFSRPGLVSGVGVGSDPCWGPSPSLLPRAAAQACLRSALSPPAQTRAKLGVGGQRE